MFEDVMEQVTPQEVTDEDMQALVNEVMADQFERGDDEQKLGMAFLGGLFSFFSRYPAELIPEAYVEAYEVMYGELPAHTKALLGSLIAFVASGYDSNQEQHDLVTAMATGTSAVPGLGEWGHAYDAEHANVVLELEDYDAIFEGVARKMNASTIDLMAQVGLELNEVRFDGGEMYLAFESGGEGDLGETVAILADPETMAALDEGWDDMGTYYAEGGEA